MKKQNTVTRAIVAVVSFGIVAASIYLGFTDALQVGAQTLPPRGGWSLDSGIITLRPGTQGARVHLVRGDLFVEDPEMQPCVVEVRILNVNGNLIGPPDAIVLRPGVGVTRVVQPEDAPTPLRYRVQVRYVEDPNVRSCPVPIVSTEIFDSRTGDTQYMHPGMIRGFNPQPDPPGFN